ncbi:triple tyrosine motif-containing protein [Chitinophaga niabensis]|uniref:Regulatory protein, luxR family n=1 Tax=Chitinophaga niabensis TaxID=536979 RepID=A0A1N6DVG2_9BACT|nr:triple tyrosine motif-containing protein [Chitinophaga niabensis]SIN74788.1 regulatory protein, luxR family [Chitinophaga niabensis]
MKSLVLFVLPMLMAAITQARQLIGAPSILHYTKQQYAGGGQTWDMDMDRHGILYFANNEGLLTFNGQNWKVLPVPNHTNLRSVRVGKDGRIYTGAQDDFGYYLPDENGLLRYTSLKPLIPSGEREFADIWNIVCYNDAVFFRSNNKIFSYKDNAIRVYPAPGEWRLLCNTPHGLYAQDAREGLMKFVSDNWRVVAPAMASQKLLITAVLEGKQDTLLVFTLKNGIFKLYNQQLFPFNTPVNEALQTDRIYCAKEWDNDQLLLGTAEGGCYILHKNTGALIQKFGIREGLQHNSVRRIFADNGRNIWLALDNGIDMIRYNSAIKQIHPDQHQYLTTYAARVFNRQLYIGTSDGLFVTPLQEHTDLSFQDNQFQKVAHTNGQVWSLATVGEDLLMTHHEGAFRINGPAAYPLFKGTGCWLFLPQQARTLIGCYNGLRTMGAALSPVRQVNLLFESLRFLTAEQDSVIWASHPYRGVYRIVLERDTTLRYTLYTQQQGLPSSYNNFVFRVRGRMVVATSSGIYEFDPIQQRFVPSAWLFPILGNTAVQYLAEDATGNIWFVSGKMPGVVDFHQPSLQKPYSIVHFPELKGMIVSGFECIYPYNEENIFIGGEKGMYHINYKKYKQPKGSPTVMISQVNARDSLLFSGYLPASAAMLKKLPNAFASFHFEYAAPSFGNNMEFSYKLEGFDGDWSEWSARTEKDYTNLPHGKYAFSVKARDNLGNISKAASYAFQILPAWHQTTLAKSIAVLLGLVLIWCCYRLFVAQQQRHKKEQARLILHHEYEKERLQNDKLAADIQFKNKELAITTMHLVQRGKLLFNIKEELLQTIQKITPSPLPSFKKVLRLFDEAEENTEDWEQFSRHFDEVHNNFLSILKKRCSDLSTTDMKLCAYLRINLTTKEIAQSMGISVRGVETSRYRLRKKLEVPADVSLYDFLLSVQGV